MNLESEEKGLFIKNDKSVEIKINQRKREKLRAKIVELTRKKIALNFKKERFKNEVFFKIIFCNNYKQVKAS